MAAAIVWSFTRRWRTFPGESEEADCLRINQWVEHVLRECPEQYLWAHRRFKSRPEGAPRLYDKKKR